MPWRGARLILTRSSSHRTLGPCLMLAAAAAAYGVALHASAPDQGCGWNCSTVVTPRGESFRDLFPSLMTIAGIAGLAGAVATSARRTRGRVSAVRCLDALALSGVFLLTLAPLTFDLRSWHREDYVVWCAVLTVLSFPLGVGVWGGLWAFGLTAIDLPYLGGDPSFGPFSLVVGLWMGLLAVAAYVEWCVLVPALLRWMGFGGEARDGG